MSEDKIADIRTRHEAGKAKFSLQIEVIDSLNYLHSLDQLHDRDCDWQTQLINVVWWALELVENGERSPSVAPKIWDALIIGDFDTTLGIATDGARVLLTELIDDRATLLAEVDRLRADNERLREALKIVRINGPDSNGLVWVSFSREGGVRVSFVVGHEEEMVSQALLEFEQIRRNALEGKP